MKDRRVESSTETRLKCKDRGVSRPQWPRHAAPLYYILIDLSSIQSIPRAEATRASTYYFPNLPPSDCSGGGASLSWWGGSCAASTPALKDFETHRRVQNLLLILIIFRREVPTLEFQVGQSRAAQSSYRWALWAKVQAPHTAAEDGTRVGWTGGGPADPLCGSVPRCVLPPSAGGRGSCCCCS